MNTLRRLEAETVDFTVPIVDAEGKTKNHHFTFSMAYDDAGHLREIVFVGRGKIGQGLDHILHELGIQMSRAIQGRDPQTGLDLAAEREASDDHTKGAA